jgi:two-component system OmpR family sensor kinase
VLARLSIRWRITLGSVLIAALIFGSALILVRFEVSSILESSDRSLAEGDLTSYVAEIRKDPSGLVDDSGLGSLVYIRDPGGRVQLETIPRVIQGQLEDRPSSNEQFTTRINGTEFIVVGQRLTTSTGTWGLWAARSTASSTLAFRGFDTVLLVGGIALFIAFGVAAWLLGSAALRPVTRMRLEAESLSAAEGAPGLPVGLANDEIRALALTINEYLDRVRRSTAREKQVVSDAAHELRTPLAALRTQLELAHGNFGDAAALAVQIVAAERTVDRLSSLATNLLALSRLEAGELDLGSSTAEELIGELMDAVDRARLVALPREVEVLFSFDVPQHSTEYRLSATSFARILDNLSSNAIGAVDRKGTVQITVAQHPKSIEITVADDGPGMPTEFLDRAFDRFSRADDSRTGATGGSGLGLALVLALCESAGGTVRLNNSHPGLVATVSLPNM